MINTCLYYEQINIILVEKDLIVQKPPLSESFDKNNSDIIADQKELFDIYDIPDETSKKIDVGAI